LYIPKHYQETDLRVLHALIDAHPFAAWVTVGAAGLIVNHIPFLFDADRGQYGTLVGHVAKANPVWRELAPDKPSVVIFQGPHSYISPSWYPSKQQDGKVVPTWNYAVVHAHGVPRIIHEREWLLRLVQRLTVKHESGREVPWSVADAPAEFIARNLEAIVGIEIPITALEGKWKMSQNQPLANRLGVVAGLRASTDPQAETVAQLVEKHAPGTAR
jgi:transcriptional regulator